LSTTKFHALWISNPIDKEINTDNVSTSHTNPGGYLEVQDITPPLRCSDDTLKGTSLDKWGYMLLEASVKLGVPLDSALTVKQMMEEVGYVDVVETIYQWPMNKWPADKRMKELGMFIFAGQSQSNVCRCVGA
jgi:hypothetical protein